MNNTCPICNNPTFLVYGKYPRKDGLCKDCSQKLFDKEIEQCPDCNSWIKTGEICKCKKKNSFKETPKETTSSELTCIICGEDSNGKHFCYDCWNLYNRKTLYLKVINCKTIIPLDAEYEGHLETKDGHIVKSHVERDIDNYLFAKNIPHAYESTYDVDGNPEHEFKPDFYLPNYLGDGKDVYIEYFGMKGTKDGNKKIEYKIPIYKKDKATLICLYPQDDSKIESVLKRKLNPQNIKEGKLNWYEE